MIGESLQKGMSYHQAQLWVLSAAEHLGIQPSAGSRWWGFLGKDRVEGPAGSEGSSFPCLPVPPPESHRCTLVAWASSVLGR